MKHPIPRRSFPISVLLALAFVVGALLLLSCASSSKAGFSGSGSGFLMKVVRGDRACYLTLRQNGSPAGYLATFDMCTKGLMLLGGPIRYKVGRVRLQSRKCQGNPECKLSVVETVITHMEDGRPKKGG